MAATRVLVLANRTVDSEDLRRMLVERHAQGPIDVTLLVPAAWEVQDPHGGAESAHRRLRDALRALRESDVPVRARLGDPDPVTALRDAWDPDRYDEIVISTLPSRLSRWLQIDLPRRAHKMTGVPVTHVAAGTPARAPGA